MKLNDVKHILISRTDNIGDVILTLPMAGILKQHFPEVKITFLAKEYVRGIVEHCQFVDHFLSVDALKQCDREQAVQQIKSLEIDVVIHAYPSKEIAVLMKKACVPFRIGTSHRLYHWITCTHRVALSRAKSDKHEAQLNLKLLKPFHLDQDYDLDMLNNYTGFVCDEPLSPHIKTFLKPGFFNLIIHPFSNGHAREWPISHFNALIRQLPADRVHVLLTGSQKENQMIQDRIVSQCSTVTNTAGQCSLRELIQLVARADGLIANSTGPLHLASVLGIPTLGLYPYTHCMHPRRWKPIGKKVTVLTANPACNSPRCRGKNDCFCMESITVDEVKAIVMGWLN